MSADVIERDRRLAALAGVLRQLVKTARARGALHPDTDLDATAGSHPGALRVVFRGRRYLLTLDEIGQADGRQATRAHPRPPRPDNPGNRGSLGDSGRGAPPPDGPVIDIGYLSLPAEVQAAVEQQVAGRDPAGGESA